MHTIWALLSSRFVCISPALCTRAREHRVLEGGVRTSNTMSTGFSAIMQPIDLGVSWKGQVDLKLLLAEDSILNRDFFSRSFLTSLCLFLSRGWTEFWLFLIFGYHYEQGKWGPRFRIKGAIGSHGDHTRNFITLLHWIDRSEPLARQNEIPREFFAFYYLSLHHQFGYL